MNKQKKMKIRQITNVSGFRAFCVDLNAVIVTVECLMISANTLYHIIIIRMNIDISKQSTTLLSERSVV